MDSLTELIKSEIKKQYKTIKEFSFKTGIPMSTLNTAFPKGIETSSYELVMRICNILKIKRIYDDEVTYMNREYYDLVGKMKSLDDQGMATVKALLTVESARCKGAPINQNITVVRCAEKTDERLKKLIRQIMMEEKKKQSV